MAKGNIILGYLRGSIGDITFFRANGQQLSRARNRAPANPRTAAQMDQRAKMACAVKFFSQVGANFFKYAFEGKKETESYFNAFVKNNIYLGGYIGKQASRVIDFPALGAWQISSGTLPEITAPFPQDIYGVEFDVGTTSDTPISTINGLSSALIESDSSRWKEGDILTCLCYCATNRANLPTVLTDQGNRAYTALWQIRLSTSNTDTLPTFGFPLLGVTFNTYLDEDGLVFEGTSGSVYSKNLFCFGLVHSRRTPNGLKVSSSTLVAPQSPELLVVVSSQSGSYYNAVIADWQASEEAILQGGLSLQSTYSAPVLLGRYNASYEVVSFPYEQDVEAAISGNELRMKVLNGENLTANMFTIEGLTGTPYVRKSTSAGAPNDAYILSVTLSQSMQVNDTVTVKFNGSVIWSFTRVS